MKRFHYILFSIICLSIIIVFCLFNFILYPKKYENYVVKYSNEYNLNPALVYAIIKAESNFNPNAISSSGAIGLMQLIPRTATWIAEELGEDYSKVNLYNPETNIKYGCFYLKYLSQKFSDQNVVICAYNAGETIVLNWIDNGILNENKITYNETKKYLKRVNSNFSVYSKKEINI